MSLGDRLKEILKDYRLRVKVRVFGEDYSVETEVRKVTSWENMGRRGCEYYISFGQVEIGMGEDLACDTFEILLYMLPEERVQKILEEYCERRLKWI